MNSNVQGAYLTFHATIPELLKSGNGYFIALSSVLAQTRVPGESAYNIAKHALNRLAEWIDIGEETLDLLDLLLSAHTLTCSIQITRKTGSKLSQFTQGLC